LVLTGIGIALCRSSKDGSIRRPERRGRNRNSLFAVVTQRSRMEREERVPLDIFRNGFFRHRMRLDQIGVMVERRLDDSIDQIFGKIFVGDSKVIEPDGRIILD